MTSFLVEPKGFFISLDSLERPTDRLLVQTDSAFLLRALVREIAGHCINKELQQRQQFATGERPIDRGVTITLTHQSRVGNVERIGPGTQIGENVRLGNFVVIGAGVLVGDNVQLDHGVQVGSDCQIGDESIVLLGASLGDKVALGTRTEINYDLEIPSQTIVEGDRLVTDLDQITSL
jgi:NDP-sugar pyrophosphorylase family protein